MSAIFCYLNLKPRAKVEVSRKSPEEDGLRMCYHDRGVGATQWQAFFMQQWNSCFITVLTLQNKF